MNMCRDSERWRISTNRGLREPRSLLSCGNSYGFVFRFSFTTKCPRALDGACIRVCSTSNYSCYHNITNKLAKRG